MKIRSLGSAARSIAGSARRRRPRRGAEILTSLQSGVIDAVEFVGPGTDIALGLYRVAPFYYYPASTSRTAPASAWCRCAPGRRSTRSSNR